MEPPPRRTSSRQMVKRVPYVGGSGGGLANKNGESSTTRKPVVERWCYDPVPCLMAQHTSLETKSIDEMPLLEGRLSEQMTIHGELTNGELSIEKPPIEFTQVPSLDYSFLDWVSEHHRDPFIITLEFPNAIDPDHPSGTVEDQDLEFFSN